MREGRRFVNHLVILNKPLNFWNLLTLSHPTLI